jgi:integrase
VSVWKHPKSGLYHFDLRFRGRRAFGPCRTAGRREAEAIEERERAALIARVELEERLAREPLTVDVAFGRYWTEVGQHHVNEATTWRDLNRLAELLGRTKRLRDVTDADMATVIAKRRADRVVPANRKRVRKDAPPAPFVTNATVNRSVRDLARKVWRRARVVWREELPHEPDWKEHRLKEPKERVREASASEEAALRGTIREDFLPLLAFAVATGLRMTEAVKLTWDRVDWDGGTMRVIGKGGKEALLPMTRKIRAILGPLRGHHPTAVFTYVAQRPIKARRIARGQRVPLTVSGLKSRWRRARGKAGVIDLRYHDLRHTFATRTLRASGNLRAVQHALRHEKVETTAKYAHALLADVRDAMEAADRLTPRLTGEPGAAEATEKAG